VRTCASDLGAIWIIAAHCCWGERRRAKPLFDLACPPARHCIAVGARVATRTSGVGPISISTTTELSATIRRL